MNILKHVGDEPDALYEQFQSELIDILDSIINITSEGDINQVTLTKLKQMQCQMWSTGVLQSMVLAVFERRPLTSVLLSSDSDKKRLEAEDQTVLDLYNELLEKSKTGKSLRLTNTAMAAISDQLNMCIKQKIIVWPM